MRMPPLIVYKLNSRMINGNVVGQHDVFERVQSTAETGVGMQNREVRERDQGQAAGHEKLIQVVLPPMRGEIDQRQDRNCAQQQREGDHGPKMSHVNRGHRMLVRGVRVDGGPTE